MKPRTQHCGELRRDHIDQTVTLSGWVNNYRDHGGVLFIDLRDREGLTQIVFHPQNADAHALANKLRNEDVIQITGKCVARDAGMENPKMTTGSIEVDATELEILNKAQTPPFTPDDAGRTGEEKRLQYRYIDLRRPKMQQILRTRSKVTKLMRDFYEEEGFLEVETPFLCRSTPEGARDYLVPSRMQEGAFYALPQSPQLFKQILMVAGVERYMQIVRCFRDEDPRADRQAEFTQLDLEMSFVDLDDVIALNEQMIAKVFKEVVGYDLPLPVKRMTYAEAMDRFGSDRPDLRFDLELVDLTDIVKDSDFKVFGNAIAAGGIVKAIRVPGGASMSRKVTDALAEWVKQFGAGGLPVTKVEAEGFATGIGKFIAPLHGAICEKMGAVEGDLICFGVDAKPTVVHRVLGELRCRLAEDLKLIPEDATGADKWNFVWVVDFPSFEYDEDSKRWIALHHPFTAPRDEDLAMLDSDPGAVLSKAYDMVLNGSEIGGGSIRIHDQGVQGKVFNLLGIDDEEAREKFGFLLDALNYGAPPHGGIAFGLDRMIMHLCDTDNIRDVIAFPKTQTGMDLMTQAPGQVDEKQLKELRLEIKRSAPAPDAAPATDSDTA